MDNIEPVSRIEQYLDRMANGGSGDLPTPVSRIEQYLNQIAEGGGGGGGGGLPTPTAADVGKTMMVQPIGGSVIAPMQSCVPDDEGAFIISNFNTSLFTVGATVLAEWNGEKMVGTVVNQLDNGNMGVAFDNPLYSIVQIEIYNGNAIGMALYASGGSAPVVTLKVSVFDSYGWEETSSTVVVKETGELTLTKTWQEIYDALTSGKLVWLVRGGYDDYGYISSNPLIYATRGDSWFMVKTAMGAEYYAESANGYPVAD